MCGMVVIHDTPNDTSRNTQVGIEENRFAFGPIQSLLHNYY